MRKPTHLTCTEIMMQISWAVTCQLTDQRLCCFVVLLFFSAIDRWRKESRARMEKPINLILFTNIQGKRALYDNLLTGHMGALNQ